MIQLSLLLAALLITPPVAPADRVSARGFFARVLDRPYLNQVEDGTNATRVCTFESVYDEVQLRCIGLRANVIRFLPDGTFIDSRGIRRTYRLYDRGLVLNLGETDATYYTLDDNGDLLSFTDDNGAIGIGTTIPIKSGNLESATAAYRRYRSEDISGRFMAAKATLARIKEDPIAALGPVPPERVGGTSSSATPLIKQASISAHTKAAGTGPRIALVLGNARYTNSLGALANPANDARLVADALRRTGFQVELVLDADQRAMKQAISRLGNRAAAAGKGATALFYYAGHGIQSKETNYLVPVGVNLTNEADLELDAVPAEAVLGQLETAGSATNIVILDACRNMPLARGTRSGTRGLARMDAPGGSFVAYSTAPGQEAVDGTGANSPFATAFAAEVAKPGQPIQIVFQNVRQQVHQATGRKQTPWDSSSLFESFYFTR